jgi:hypothetical protein
MTEIDRSCGTKADEDPMHKQLEVNVNNGDTSARAWLREPQVEVALRS